MLGAKADIVVRNGPKQDNTTRLRAFCYSNMYFISQSEYNEGKQLVESFEKLV